ncbi:helix-turn-helix transcriptional regulator [Paenibacillus sp. SYP-B3998]|uniref:Helix-turn-helix transcriptional regulator n=1 Tax=Paenibacillus sp. SYP-B3998 TaxID=2678564 RepID=A0A6G3ZRD5_9BACL|nr:helix-turn-helix transcriptional regulator [Paenibacillus sp. SYP-B3998]
MTAAHELMNSRGHSLASMDDIAAEAGIAKMTLYQHFPSKEELTVRLRAKEPQTLFP